MSFVNKSGRVIAVFNHGLLRNVKGFKGCEAHNGRVLKDLRTIKDFMKIKR